MGRYIKKYPDELDLLEFFCAEPYHREVPEGNFAYLYTDAEDVTLDFGFSIIEGWLSIFIRHNEKDVVHTTYEGIEKFAIKEYKKDKYIQAIIEAGAFLITLKIYVEPSIRVETWIADSEIFGRKWRGSEP